MEVDITFRNIRRKATLIIDLATLIQDGKHRRAIVEIAEEILDSASCNIDSAEYKKVMKACYHLCDLLSYVTPD